MACVDEAGPDVSPLVPGGSGASVPVPGGGAGRALPDPPRRGLLWYADLPARRSRQVLADVSVAVWCAVWLLVGVAVHQAVSSLVGPTRALAGGADRTAAQLDRGGDGVARVPLVGEEAAAPFRAAAGSVSDIATQTAEIADTVGSLAVLLAVLVPLAPVCLVLALWLPARLRYARRAGAARALVDAGADPQLFALRALTTQPLPRLAAVSADPVGDWRRGDPVVTARLAGLELQRLGLRAPTPRGDAPVPR